MSWKQRPPQFFIHIYIYIFFFYGRGSGGHSCTNNRKSLNEKFKSSFCTLSSFCHFHANLSFSDGKGWSFNLPWRARGWQTDNYTVLPLALVLSPRSPSLPHSQENHQINAHLHRLLSQEKITDSHFWIFLGI